MAVPLFTQFSHFIDLLHWIFGDITIKHASLTNNNHKHSTEFEDTGVVTFALENGSLGSINYSTSVYNKNMESSITIIGGKGTIKVGGQYMDQLTYCDIENYNTPKLEATQPPNDYGDYKGSAANHHWVIQNVVDVLNTKASINSNSIEGLKTVEIIESIYKYR